MKTNLLRKLKICNKIFLIFALTIFFANSWIYTKAAEEKGCKNGEDICIQDCDWSFSGQCVVTTEEIEEDGKEITRIMEIPMGGENEFEDGRVTDKYTDSEGNEYYRTGTVNIDEEVTYISDWKTAEEYEKELDDLNSPEGTWNELEDSGEGDKFIYTLLQPLPQEGKDLQENVTLEEYLAWVYGFALTLAGFLAVMMIVIGGVEYIISGANESMKSAANKRIWGAIWGLVLVMAAYIILYTINPSLVDFGSNLFFNDETRWDENSDSNIGDFNDTTTDTGDMPS